MRFFFFKIMLESWGAAYTQVQFIHKFLWYTVQLQAWVDSFGCTSRVHNILTTGMTNSIVNKSTDHAKPLSICQVEDSVNTIRQQLNGGEGKTMKVIEEIKKIKQHAKCFATHCYSRSKKTLEFLLKHAIDVLPKHHKLKCVTNKRIIKYLHYYVDGSW